MGVTSSFCCTDRSGTRRQSKTLSTCYVDFQKPAEVTQQGGAQARLFRLLPVVAPSGTSRRSLGSGGPEWLGKDVSSSFNEVDFYNEVLHMRRWLQQDPPLQPVPKLGQQVKEDEDDSNQTPWGIIDFMVSYHGLARSCTCSWTTDGRQRQRVADLLVFRSPFEGLARPRMLHLELGPRSLALQARHENEVSTGILARQEGVFVDGFLAPPQSIPSEGPTLDLRGWSWGDNTQRRAKRLPLQRLQLSEALNSLLDLRAAIAEERFWPSEDTVRSSMRGDAFLQNFLSAVEYSELALRAFVSELTKLLRACEEVPVPQKWVQSSLALLVEAGVAPPRVGPIQPEVWVASRVKIQILGWSKSRLSLPQHTSADERQDHELPWKIYQHHVGRVLWESARLYFHSFCAEEWATLKVQLYEVSKGNSTVLCSGTLNFSVDEVQPKSEIAVQLFQGDKALQNKLGCPSQVMLKVNFLSLPEPSHFAGLWQVRVDRSENLDVKADALCMVLVATSTGSRHSMSHRTKEAPGAAEICWNEDFEFPVIPAKMDAPAAERLLEALGQPIKTASPEALADAMGPTGSVARHLPPLVMMPEEGKKEDVRTASTGQVAFISELRAGWYESRCGLTETA